MKTIHKYMLEVTREQQVEIPGGAEKLTAQIQSGVPCLWAIVDPEAAKVPCTVYIVGTGHPMPRGIDAGHHWGTVQMTGLVWHVFVMRTPQ